MLTFLFHFFFIVANQRAASIDGQSESQMWRSFSYSVIDIE